jgi:hypothetical protein
MWQSYTTVITRSEVTWQSHIEKIYISFQEIAALRPQ